MYEETFLEDLKKIEKVYFLDFFQTFVFPLYKILILYNMLSI